MIKVITYLHNGIVDWPNSKPPASYLGTQILLVFRYARMVVITIDNQPPAIHKHAKMLSSAN